MASQHAMTSHHAIASQQSMASQHAMNSKHATAVQTSLLSLNTHSYPAMSSTAVQRSLLGMATDVCVETDSNETRIKHDHKQNSRSDQSVTRKRNSTEKVTSQESTDNIKKSTKQTCYCQQKLPLRYSDDNNNLYDIESSGHTTISPSSVRVQRLSHERHFPMSICKKPDGARTSVTFNKTEQCTGQTLTPQEQQKSGRIYSSLYSDSKTSSTPRRHAQTIKQQSRSTHAAFYPYAHGARKAYEETSSNVKGLDEHKEIISYICDMIDKQEKSNIPMPATLNPTVCQHRFQPHVTREMKDGKDCHGGCNQMLTKVSQNVKSRDIHNSHRKCNSSDVSATKAYSNSFIKKLKRYLRSLKPPSKTNPVVGGNMRTNHGLFRPYYFSSKVTPTAQQNDTFAKTLCMKYKRDICSNKINILSRPLEATKCWRGETYKNTTAYKFGLKDKDKAFGGLAVHGRVWSMDGDRYCTIKPGVYTESEKSNKLRRLSISSRSPNNKCTPISNQPPNDLEEKRIHVGQTPFRASRNSDSVTSRLVGRGIDQLPTKLDTHCPNTTRTRRGVNDNTVTMSTSKDQYRHKYGRYRIVMGRQSIQSKQSDFSKNAIAENDKSKHPPVISIRYKTKKPYEDSAHPIDERPFSNTNIKDIEHLISDNIGKLIMQTMQLKEDRSRMPQDKNNIDLMENHGGS